jgi:tetratricopeptide (TPR) repeat protein
LVKINLKTDTDKKVLAEIDDKMKGVSQATYYQAAVYYLENDKDLNKALEWIDKALINNEQFWILRHKAMILAKLGRYKEAITLAERSMKLAAEAENDDFKKQDEKAIAEWRALLK